MPSFGDVFTVGGDASGYIEAIARANAALNASKSSVAAFAAESVAGNNANLGSLKALAGANEELKGKIGDLNAAHKQWAMAAQKGTDDVAAKEQAYKAALNEVQQITMRSATVINTTKQQLAATTEQQAEAERKVEAETLAAARAAEHLAVIQHAGAASVDAATAKKIEQYARLKKEEEELQAAMKRTEKDITAGIPNAAAAYGTLEKKLQDVTARKRALGNEAGTLAGKSMNLNFILGQLSYGAQDLVSVLSQPGMGLSDALRSTGNNIGVVAQVAGGPLMGALATAGIMAASFGAKMLEAGDGAKKAKVDSEDFNDTLRAIASTAKDSTDEINELIKAQIDLGDVEFQKKMAPMREKKKDADTEVETEQANVEYYQKQLARENAANPFGTRKTSSVIEGYKKRLEAAEKKRSEIDQKIKDAEAVHNAALSRIETRKTERSFDKRFDAVDDPLRVMARREMETFGPHDEGALTNKIAKSSGIVPANDVERGRMNERIATIITNAKEGASKSELAERLTPEDERQKKRKEIFDREQALRFEEMRRPLAEQERKLQEEREAYGDAHWKATRPGSPGKRGGRDISVEEQADLDARKERLDEHTRALHEHKRAIDRLIEQMKASDKINDDSTKATKENTEATKSAAGVPAAAVGFKFALNPFAGL